MKSSTLKKFEAKLKRNTAETEKNIPFTHAELVEAAESQPKFRLMNDEENRRARRIKENAGKILNNRKQTTGRKNNNVLNKMARFSLWLHYHQSRMARA